MNESEHKIQNDIRVTFADKTLPGAPLEGKLLLFRANVGEAWTGISAKLQNGHVVIKNPRRFSTGLPAGFSDLFGVASVTITPDMVGQKIGVFVAAEIKTPTGRVSEKQKNFREAVNKIGGKSYVWRDVDTAVADIEKLSIDK